ncbi:hypothetical protein [Pseudoalteromonas sp. SWXJZ10B]|uniref:hypothetical protein n=1 Tax=Pseudoalteromonas sp. SWXJZ10B TaxID=2792063 RepID=UPI0018CDB54E|nr:hypothetical protein [Pseudoalteromonas sp. SWXJZ10B]MBH0042007.1 hypothetical protein [Pseudoalteromonas sp. SWXJZ10B]
MSYKNIGFTNIFVLLVTFLVSSCSTAPVRLSESIPISNQSTYLAYAKYSLPKKSGSKIIIVRDSGLFGSAIPATLFINGERVASLAVSESIVLHVNLEDNLIGVAPISQLSSESSSLNLIEHSLHVTPNKTYAYRITVGGESGLILQRSSQL